MEKIIQQQVSSFMMEYFSMEILTGYMIPALISTAIFHYLLLVKDTSKRKWKACGRFRFQRRDSLETVVKNEAPVTSETYLVIGIGFIGMEIVNALLARGETKVRGFDRKKPRQQIDPKYEDIFTFIEGDVHDEAALDAALDGVDVVYSTFSLLRYYESLIFQYEESYNVNVKGMEMVIAACLRKNIKFFVHTSTCTVNVVPRTCGLAIMNEDGPYVTPENSLNHYFLSKALQEKIALGANGRVTEDGSSLKTVSIRPCGVFGANDGILTERHMTQGYVDIIYGTGGCDYVYVENVVWGHLLAEKGLRENENKVGGEAFVIAQDEPTTNEDFYRGLKKYYDARTGESFGINYLPIHLLTMIAKLLETYSSFTRKRIPGLAALVTPSCLELMRLKFTFTCEKATKILGYKPLYNLEEAMDKTVHDFLKIKLEKERKKTA